jgi:hypothetical protein
MSSTERRQASTVLSSQPSPASRPQCVRRPRPSLPPPRALLYGFRGIPCSPAGGSSQGLIPVVVALPDRPLRLCPWKPPNPNPCPRGPRPFPPGAPPPPRGPHLRNLGHVLARIGLVDGQGAVLQGPGARGGTGRDGGRAKSMQPPGVMEAGSGGRDPGRGIEKTASSEREGQGGGSQMRGTQAGIGSTGASRRT